MLRTHTYEHEHDLPLSLWFTARPAARVVSQGALPFFPLQGVVSEGVPTKVCHAKWTEGPKGGGRRTRGGSVRTGWGAGEAGIQLAAELAEAAGPHCPLTGPGKLTPRRLLGGRAGLLEQRF